MFVLVAFHCVGLILKGNGFRFCSSEGFSASAELRRSPFIDRENRNKGRLCSREKAVLTHCTVSQAFASLARALFVAIACTVVEGRAGDVRPPLVGPSARPALPPEHPRCLPLRLRCVAIRILGTWAKN